jgi:translocation and assembly module TamB
MRIPRKVWKRLAVVVATVFVAAVVVREWVVPALIVGQIRARYGGRVAIHDWWLNGQSAGVRGLVLHEGPGTGSPVWATADRVETDLTLAGLLRGRTSPDRITLRGAAIVVRVDRQGRPMTGLALKGVRGGGSAKLPDVVVERGNLTIAQEGRRPMAVTGIDARLTAEGGGGGERLSAKANDPTWGVLTAEGRFADGFTRGSIDLDGPEIPADPAKAARLPFVSPEVWQHVVPEGPVGVHMRVAWGPGEPTPVGVRTLVTYRKTTLRLPSLGLVAEEATGPMEIDGSGMVRLDGVSGRAAGGRVTAQGRLDFTREPSKFDVDLNLDHLDVAKAPKSWQLGEAGLTGRLTGKARVRAMLAADGVDLTGSSGDAVVEGGTVEGIPVKSLRLVMHAEGNDLKYETGSPRSTGSGAGNARTRRLIGALPLMALQAAAKASSPQAPPKRGLVLPKSITTEIELEDVDLVQLVARVEAMGIRVPVSLAGKLSLKAKATIPLGKLRDLKEYTFQGDATLKGANIAGIDFGRLTASLELKDGVLDLNQLKGQLVDRPQGGRNNPPEPTGTVPDQGPLPSGGFRANLHAELSPPGKLTARFEGNALPVGELAAPALPRPTPVSGLLSVEAQAESRADRLSDPKTWSASGRAESARIIYRGTTLDAASATFRVADGTLYVPDLAAQLAGKPLKAGVRVGLAAPYDLDASLDVAGWEIADVLAFIPTAPKPAPAAGTLTARAEAKGTLSPRDLRSDGRGRIDRFRAGPVPLGDVPFRWETKGDVIAVTVADARPFGGRLSVEATVPTTGGKPIEGRADVADLDTAALAAAVPGGGLTLGGRASGRLGFVLPPSGPSGFGPLKANVKLSAPDLTVQGIPAKGLEASLQVRDWRLSYDLFAESLGGRVKLKGDIPLAATSRPKEANAELRAVGFDLAGVWPALGMGGALAHLEGLGAIDANLRAGVPAFDLRARGIAEVRDLRWGRAYPLGWVRGEVALTPAGWRIDPLGGELWDGPVRGSAWGQTPRRGPRRAGFDLEADRVDLTRLLAVSPALAKMVQGFGHLKLSGRLDEVLHANGEMLVDRGRVYGLPLASLRAPTELAYTPATGQGTLDVRRWSTRLAGGQASGDARLNLGIDRSFQGDVQLVALDLATLIRTETEAVRPGSGKVNGRVTVAGPDPDDLRRLRGRVVIDLDDASVGSLPVFRELDRFLGSASGGLFEDGDLVGTLGHGQLAVEELTLVGRTVQMHATGSVGFDTRLDLVVLVNTSQLIPETGQALVGIIPGLGDAMGRRDEAVRSVAGFLSNRLLKFRVGGTLRNPSINIDPAVVVSSAAVGFFGDVLKLPAGLLR